MASAPRGRSFAPETVAVLEAFNISGTGKSQLALIREAALAASLTENQVKVSTNYSLCMHASLLEAVLT